MISSEAIKEFQELYLQEYGKQISDEEAMHLGINLLTLMNHVYRPMKKDWLASTASARHSVGASLPSTSSGNMTHHDKHHIQ